MQDGEDLHQVPISDVAPVRAILINAAKGLRATCHAEVLDALGHGRLERRIKALPVAPLPLLMRLDRRLRTLQRS